ncbi:hypothetical protein EW145_g5382 [Phellinidium pouzarii]|uniref:C2H2-type domain-containing protein n=1 Tax=Phellinidium pouzarii TaxID=167371 RepID=A0A4S4L1H8_9AGAM|nr:hypothetical protein EW145_g5382 [Phellinidium pouzarii]
MDTYPTLLSPIDNFSFSHFTNSSGKPASPTAPSAAPRTPLPKSSNDWHELLDGFSFNIWDSPFDQRQASATAWRPDIFRSLSDSFTDSPSSSSSFLSSTTCSPWETCPGLTPASPELPTFDDLRSHYPGPLQFDSAGESSANAFNGLSLGSPLRSPILLPYQSESGVVEPYNLMNHHHTTTSIDTSNLISNALALDLSVDTNFAGSSQPESILLPPFGESLLTPLRSKSPSPFSELNEASSPPAGVSTHTGGKIEENHLLSAGFPSENYLQTRVTRRKTSRIDYAEEGYEGDSDDDYEEGNFDDSPRSVKRRRAGQSGATFSLDSDEELSEDTQESVGRGRKPRGPGRGKGGNAGAAAKRKCKQRHHCPRDGCRSSFTRVTDMERHVASVHRPVDTDANRCAFCRKAFSREDAVLRHENDSCPMRPKKKAVERWM